MRKTSFRKLFLVSIILLLSAGNVFAQDDAETETESVSENKLKSFFQNMDFLIEFSPSVYINPESSQVSAPSPVIYPVGIGFMWPEKAAFSIQPTLSFFMMYHLWYDGMALPAEIENRTSQTLCLLLDVPAVYSLFQNEKSRFQFSAGLAFLMRFGFLANGVKDSDSGYTGSASGDMDKINSWFWQNARFLYVSLGAGWLYSVSEHLKVGPEIKLYLPAGSLISGEGVQAMIVSAGLKLCL